MIRLLVTSPLSTDVALPLDDGQSRYLTQVMRKGVGDEVLVFNGIDGEWRCAIEQVGKRFVILRTRALTRPQTPTPDLILLIALIKRGRLETVVEKASELGVAEVWPVVTERAGVERAREDRLRLIAHEAAEQTGRLDTPEIKAPAKLDKVMADWDKTWPEGRKLLFCDEAGDAGLAADVLATQTPGPWAILIGPEGGFSPAERIRLRSLPFTVPVSLGPRILRADTAAISAMTLWQCALGDWR
ncbi:MAG: 16S rRNA (uracil(1498)-N(3))-methyltransferase [Phenylobacterium zucineum]|nr:MAG: 16S rRNA (uracil(1498)-N(3))-methyltransferase [Phenylobacterium zucineum]